MPSTIRIGFIGCGMIAMIHFQSMDLISQTKLLDLEVVGAYDTDPERLKMISKGRPSVRPYDDPESLIKNHQVDAIFICTPTKFHKRYVMEAAAAGKDIFCEKPMATNLANAEEMLSLVEKAGVKAQVGLVLRYDPILNFSKHLIDGNKDKIGIPMDFVLRDDQFFPIRGQYQSTWRKDRDLTGGGTLIEHSIHDIDFMTWFFGETKELKASMRYFSGREVEDQANVWFRFENDAEGMLTSIWHEIGARSSNRLIEIFYSKALFHIELDGVGKSSTPYFYQMEEENPAKISYKEANDYLKEKLGIRSKYELGEYTYEVLAFLKSIQNDKQPNPGFSRGVHAHRIIEAAYHSARNGSAIKLR